MQTNFTPGPWRTDEAEHQCPHQHIRIKGGHHSIAEVWIDDAPDRDYNTEQRANARLIAAAPDLFEALLSYVELGHSDTAVREARAALSKALGRPA